jgi:hypothetical protein
MISAVRLQGPAVGSTAMRRVQTTVDLDLVEKRFGGLSVSFERSLSAFEQKALETLSEQKHFPRLLAQTDLCLPIFEFALGRLPQR